MVIKLLPRQIPAFWEAIKHAAINADEVDEKDKGAYLNDLLHSLLNSKCQCFIKMNYEKRLQALLLTRFLVDKVTGEKNLFILPLFAWQRLNSEEWEEGFLSIKKFAEKEKCFCIFFSSRNPKIWQLGEQLGFEESLRSFRLVLGGE